MYLMRMSRLNRFNDFLKLLVGWGFFMQKFIPRPRTEIGPFGIDDGSMQRLCTAILDGID